MHRGIGEELRGKLMANGKKFDPDKMTAASWFYPIGARVRVTLATDRPGQSERSVVVTITDRGPAKHLVRDGRIIDLARAAFEKLAPDRPGADTDCGQPRGGIEIGNPIIAGRNGPIRDWPVRWRRPASRSADRSDLAPRDKLNTVSQRITLKK